MNGLKKNQSVEPELLPLLLPPIGQVKETSLPHMSRSVALSQHRGRVFGGV